MDITPTRHGLRLSQHGVVISELRTAPGPTDSIFDVLAALITELAPPGRVGVLGFAGGGMMAPLAALGWERPFDAVDLDREAYELFRSHCPHWAGLVNWHHADAGAWLRRQRSRFSLLLDDLSVPADGDIFKPALSWNELPGLIRTRLQLGGIALFNLLLSPGDTWERALPRITRHFGSARVIHLDDFENRLLIAGDELPSARVLSRKLGQALRRLGSSQTGRIRVLRIVG